MHNLKLVTTKRFDKNLIRFLKVHPELKQKVKVLLTQLVKNPFNPKLKTHKLSGNFSDLHASSLSYSYRVVFHISNDTITMINIGAHEDVY